MTVITRFAPSPTGKLHIGNARAALLNWLYARQHNGQFILRFDDTDLERSKEEYKDAIRRDLEWLGLNWDHSFTQSSRLLRYADVKAQLLKLGRLYPCFESQEELDVKRKLQLASGMPPIYDRSALNLTAEQVEQLITQGKKPHYRFLMDHTQNIAWDDMVKGTLKYNSAHLNDPIVIREDGSMTYMLCSVIDDIDYNITHIIRGEDHVTNTAIQIQMFNAIGAHTVPSFGHFSMVTSQDEKISKRAGGFEIESLHDTARLESMAINSFFAMIGSSKAVKPYKDLKSLAHDFDVYALSKSPTTYIPEELERLNHKLLLELSFADIKTRLTELDVHSITEEFWLAVRPNLTKLQDVKTWWQICYAPVPCEVEDKELLKTAASLLPEEISANTWKEWTGKISASTGKKGKELFIPLRLALTGMDHGPELGQMLPLIARGDIMKRLGG